MSNLDLENPPGFASDFVANYLSQGFQSLSKRDIDLLVFLLLEKDGAISRSASNFDIARLLRVTPSRVRALRRDSYARWRHLLVDRSSRDQLKAVLVDVLTPVKINAGAQYVPSHLKAAGCLAIRVEHPDDREALERALVDCGELPRYERNKDLLVVRFASLLKLAEDNEFILGLQDAIKALKLIAPVSERLRALLVADIKDLRWPEVREVLTSVAVDAIAESVKNVDMMSVLKIAFPFLSSRG